jgi:hypothetical protein
MTRHQLPGRREALRLVLSGEGTPLLRHIAGMNAPIQRQPPGPALQTMAPFSSGIEKLTPEERAALPF